ncbi:MAG: metal transporter CNNM [Candidatus Saccharimonadales bacterium]|jgi:metal transporter CNNM
MGTPLFIIAIVLLLASSALFSGLTLGILSLNHYELKRKAQLGNKAAKIVYPIRELGHQLMITLLIGNVVVNAAITALLNQKINGLFAVLLTTIFVVIFGEILPMAYLRKHGLKVTAKMAPILKQFIALLSPIARPLGKLLDGWMGEEGPSVYSKEELYKILEEHRISEDSDIEEDEVQIVRHALSFGDKQVREVMTPERVVKTVSSNDHIGPILIDELHKSGYSRFPVYNDKKAQNFIGTLYLRDLVGLDKEGSVKDHMRKEVLFVHEEDALDTTLQLFLKTNHHILIVVNSFEEFVGVVTIEDVIEEVIGKQIVDEFDQHTDLRVVARSQAAKEKEKREKEKKQN